MKFAIGLADGTDAPTNTGNVFTLATTRSWYEITGAVKSETDNIGTAADTLTAQIVIVPTALLRLERARLMRALRCNHGKITVNYSLLNRGDKIEKSTDIYFAEPCFADTERARAQGERYAKRTN